LPSDIKKVPRPIIGFIGAISSYKLDFDLIKSIASSRPEWSIVLIGPRGEGEKAVDLSPLKRYKNIFYFGPRRYEELPGYLKAFDVCILPCAINDYTQAMFPMKFFEYLASGKQVVTTDLPSLREFKSFCKVAETPKEFVGKIEDCLREDSATQIRKRIDLAKRYSWERRLEEISTLIQRRLEDQRDAGK
jgi:glycosyltransferase involved in cell wall biosynthesis